MSLQKLAKRFSAVDLFCHEARKLDIDIADNETERLAIARICRLVGGLPLGIQLATAWLPVLTCSEIAAEVTEHIDFLVSHEDGAMQQQRNLQALLTHTFAGLGDEERDAYLGLSVFPASFDRLAAESVGGAKLPLLRSLVDKTLVRRVAPEPADDGGSPRFALPRLLRQYTRERLGEDPVREVAAMGRHACYFTSFLHQRHGALRGADQARALREIEAETANVRQAWAYAAARRQVGWLGPAVDALGEYYCQRGQYQEGRLACRGAARHLQEAQMAQTLQARLLAWEAVFEIAVGRTRHGRTLLHQCLSLLEGVGPDSALPQAFVTFHLSRLATPRDLGTAEALCEQAFTLYKNHGDHRDMGVALRQMAAIKVRRGEFADALQAFAASTHFLRIAGDTLGLADVLGEWANASAGQGDLTQAETLAREAHALYQNLDNRASQANILQQMGQLLIWQGKSQEAVVLLNESLALYKQLGFQRKLPGAHTSLAGAYANTGAYGTARRLLTKAFALAKEMKDRASRADVLWLSGWICLAKRGYEAAQEHLQESVDIYRRLGNRIGLSHAQAALACTEVQLGNLSGARTLLSRALRLSADVRYPYSALAAINGCALLLAAQGRMERALELAALTSGHAVVRLSCLFYDSIQHPLEAMIESLPGEAIRTAQARGERLDLWTTVETIADELTLHAPAL